MLSSRSQSLAACHAGGSYAKGNGFGGDVDRGETNGRMFDFVSNKPEGDDWQIRIRGSSLWASYGERGLRATSSGPTNLTNKETNKLWNLVDAIEIPDRKKGKKDEDEGYVQLTVARARRRSRHDIFTIYVSRATPKTTTCSRSRSTSSDLVEKHFKEKPNF